MLKEIYHPNAYLSNIKNIKRGLLARTRILNVLDKCDTDARTISEESRMRYGVVAHHLKLLHYEGIVERKGKRPYTWALTGLGQRRLESPC
jgi:predicted transcriptional regulator